MATGSHTVACLTCAKTAGRTAQRILAVVAVLSAPFLAKVAMSHFVADTGWRNRAARPAHADLPQETTPGRRHPRWPDRCWT